MSQDVVTAVGRAPSEDRALWSRVKAWIDDDPDPACRAELTELLDRGAADELRERFGGGLHFGTAGLRGRLGAGPSRINRATVRRATAGLAAYLLESTPAVARGGVVIGYDARHGSAELAQETARVLTGAGLRALRLPGRLPTPVLAFAVRHLGAGAGVMVTASHLPAVHNGYKVYLADGAPIIPPADREISAAMQRVANLTGVPLGNGGDRLGEAIIDAYLEAIIGALPASRPRTVSSTRTESSTRTGGNVRTGGSAPELRVLYTPLHGVGRDVLVSAFARAGFPAPLVVGAQAEPDPDFATVKRPNPEEPGTLDLALAEAARVEADILLANDPDADRLAVAIPAASAPGGWQVLRGDEIGALLADYLLRTAADPEHALLVTTVASSRLLERLVRAAGARYAETLTGFKWIMHVPDAIPDARLLFGYEEALGYAVNDIVRDKDGISAALAMAELGAYSKMHGRTLSDHLDDLARRFGLHATGEWSLELPDRGGQIRIREVMQRLRASPPQRLGGRRITAMQDLAAGGCRGTDGRDRAPALPSADVLILHCQDELRVVIRPSGTECKLKIYLEVVLAVDDGDVAAARQRAASELDGLRAELSALTRS